MMDDNLPHSGGPRTGLPATGTPDDDTGVTRPTHGDRARPNDHALEERTINF